jgi:hypothetical protein
MRFELNEDQALLQRSTRDFFAAEYPLEQSRRLMEDDPRGFDDAAWGRLAEMGYLGLTVPTEQGGQGLGAIDFAIVLEEAGRQCIPGPLLDAGLAADLLARGGEDARLADLLAGRRLVTIARRGALFGATPGDAPVVADGRIRGTSSFVPFATAADALIVVAGDALVLADGPFDVTPLPTIDPAQRFGRVDFEHAVTALGPATLLEDTDRLAAVGAATGVEFNVRETWGSCEVNARLSEVLGFIYRVSDWHQLYSRLFEALKLEKFAMVIILLLIVLVASFNIV